MSNLNTLNHSAFILRLTFGFILLAHGLMKVIIFTIPGTIGYFDSLGLPAIAAHLTIWGEILGGLALMAGFHTRIIALLTLPLLIGATWAHAANGWIFSNEGGGWEYPALLLILAIVVSIQGGGSFSVRGLPQLNARLPKWLKA